MAHARPDDGDVDVSSLLPAFVPERRSEFGQRSFRRDESWESIQGEKEQNENGGVHAHAHWFSSLRVLFSKNSKDARGAEHKFLFVRCLFWGERFFGAVDFDRVKQIAAEFMRAFLRSVLWTLCNLYLFRSYIGVLMMSGAWKTNFFNGDN